MDVFTNSSPSSSPYSLVSSSEVLHDAAKKVGWKAGLLGARSGRAPRGPVRGMRLVECRIFVHTFLPCIVAKLDVRCTELLNDFLGEIEGERPNAKTVLSD